MAIYVVISGANNSGKDQFSDYFIKHYENKSISMSTIDRIKDLSTKYFGWNGKKTEESRKFLSEMKRIWSEYNNGPFLDMIKKINSHYSKLNKKNKQNIVYFIHCREPNEIQKFKDKYGDNCKTILLKRDDRTISKSIANNDSDKNVDNYNYDLIIQNNGDKLDLELKAIKFVEEIRNILKIVPSKKRIIKK